MKTNWPAFRLGYILVAGAAVAALPARAQIAQRAAATASVPSASISRVEVDRAGQQTTVRIGGNRGLSYQELRLSNPPRLVLDFADARLALPGRAVASEYLPVRDVRLGQQGSGQARVVIDLAKFVPYTVQTEGSNVTVSFTAPVAAPVPAAISPTHVPRKSKLVPTALPDMPLPAWLTGQSVGFARPAIEPPAPEAQNPPLAAPAAPAPQAQAPAAPRYTGEPISVNLKDVDLKDFFRLIHEISGLNVVLDPTVKGSVTLVLDEVPWDQGLDIVLRNNGLSQEIEGNVLRIATQETLKREADQRRDLLKAQSDAIETVTVTRVLSYAQAEKMKDTLKKFLSSRGDILSDDRSNQLIIRDIPSVIPVIDNLIRQLDRKSQQVEIEARVVSATRPFARDIGTQLGFATTATSGRNIAA